MTKETPMIKPNVLLHADALTALRELPRGIADALITDPPYSSGGQFRGDRARDTKAKYLSSRKIAADYAKHSFTGDSLDQRSWTSWAAEWLSLARDAVRPGGVAAVFIDWRQLGALCEAIQWAGWIWRGIIVWDKKSSRPQPGRPRQQCEFIVWASNGPLDINRNAPYMPGIFTAPPPIGRKAAAPNGETPRAYAGTRAPMRSRRRGVGSVYGKRLDSGRRHFGRLRVHRV